MANPAWPGTLPQFVERQGYNERLPDQTIESPVDAGEAKIRRRYTTGNRLLQVEMKMTNTQAGYFDTFYLTTLAAGTLPFDWVHPRYRTATTFIFRKPPPSYSALAGANCLVKFTLETRP